MFHKIIQDCKKLTIDELQELQVHLQREIRRRKESAGHSREIIGEKNVGSMCYHLAMIRCGKKECKCSRGELHGPYWYVCYRENGKTKRKYVGKTLPDSTAMLKVSEALRKKAEKARAKSGWASDLAEQARLRAGNALSWHGRGDQDPFGPTAGG